MKNSNEDIPSPEKRLRIAREHHERPSIYPGDVVKKRRYSGRPRDDRLFLVLGVAFRRKHYWYWDSGSHNGEDYLIIKEYKKKNAPVIIVRRKGVWFTGKQLSL
jgi:hypothetical protein